MSLADNINTRLKEAMKQKDEAALRALRAIKSAILLANTEKGGGSGLSGEQEMQILQKLAKQRKESIEVFRAQNREDLAATEEEELKIISDFLPEQMSEEDVKKILKEIIAEQQLKSPSEIGKLMPLALQKLNGKADGKMISSLGRALLSGNE